MGRGDYSPLFNGYFRNNGLNNGVVSCLPFAPLDINWRLHSVGLTLLIDKYVNAKVVNKKALVNSHHAIDTDRNG